MTIHHIVSDGWSVGVLAGELNALSMDCTGLPLHRPGARAQRLVSRHDPIGS
jgi:hypothetical protein